MLPKITDLPKKPNKQPVYNSIKNNINILTVSINYSDYLKYYLDVNTKYFDNITIITHESDKETIRLCNDYKVNVFLTDKISHKNCPFNKSYMINKALAECGFKDWILLLDSDIILTDDSVCVKYMDLDVNTMYGVERELLDNKEEFDNRQPQPDFVVQMPSRHFRVDGFRTNGFYQLFNVNSDVFKSGWRYNEDIGMGYEDLNFSFRFKRERLPFDVYHIGVTDVNWRGRVSKEFQ